MFDFGFECTMHLRNGYPFLFCCIFLCFYVILNTNLSVVFAFDERKAYGYKYSVR